MGKKSNSEPEEIQLGETYDLIKVWIKRGAKSGIPVGIRKIKFCEIPTVGKPVTGTYDSEHPLSGDPKKVTYMATKPVVDIKRLNGFGLRIVTTTSVYVVPYKK